MRIIFTLIALCSALVIIAQGGQQISGKVLDAQSGLPVFGGYISIPGTTYGATTNEKGFYTIKNVALQDTFTLIVRHVAYATIARSGYKFSGKSLKIDFNLEPSTFELPGLTISAAPDTVWGSKELNVADFAFTPEGILLLTYEKEERWKRQEDVKKTLFSGCNLIHVDAQGKELVRALAPSPSLGFYLNYYNEIFLQCHNEVYFVKSETEAIHLQAFPKEDFKTYIEPVVDTIGSTVYFSNYNASYPAFEYMAFNMADSSYHTLRYLIDEELMQRFRAQYRDLSPRDKLEAFRTELETGIDKEVVSAYMTGFPSTPFFQPLNIPLIIAKDTLLIFDHVHDKLIRYNNFDEPLDSALISYHRTRGGMKWGGSVIRDDVTGKIFTWFEKNGIIHISRIDPTNGKAEHMASLSYKYAEKLKIHNGKAYYIYRPFESSQNRFLYSEKLPID
ncbi:MAG: carboxypeptidase-like regulatory domain-containing protein [Flavobacteriales bacterium]